MVTRRSAKNKGNQFEYQVTDSLAVYYLSENPQNLVYLTKELGFVKQYDVHVSLAENKTYIAVECKFHKAISWNEAKKLYYKLKSVTPDAEEWFLIYKTNQEPVLVMDEDVNYKIRVREFSDVFGIECKRWSKEGDKNEK